MTTKKLTALIPRMANKVKIDRGLHYRICAIAFTKRNNLLGIEMNNFRNGLSNRPGAGSHAEATLIKKYGKRIDKIYVMRVGNACDALPIHPCENCSKLAEKYNIKIIPMHEVIDNINEFIKK